MSKFEDVLEVSKFEDVPIYEDGTLGWCIDKYIGEMCQPGRHGIGTSTLTTMRLLQRSPIGSNIAAKLKRAHYTEHARLRGANLIPTNLRRKQKLAELSPSTVTKDFAVLSVVLTHANDEWELKMDLEELKSSIRTLRKGGLIAKSQPRDRRPDADELARLEAHFDEQNRYGRTEIDMVMFARWQRYSSRRVGESCRLLWEDWNRDAHTILVRKMKDPRRKNKAKVVALPEAAQIMLEQLWLVRDPSQPRIFPYVAKSCSARYTLAKKALGIKDLRLHDSRRDCASSLIEEGHTSSQVILVTGHETTMICDRVYARPRPEKFKEWEAERASP